MIDWVVFLSEQKIAHFGIMHLYASQWLKNVICIGTVSVTNNAFSQ